MSDRTSSVSTAMMDWTVVVIFVFVKGGLVIQVSILFIPTFFVLNFVASVMTVYILMVGLTIVVGSSFLSSLVMVIFTSSVVLFGQMGVAHAPFLVLVFMA